MGTIRKGWNWALIAILAALATFWAFVAVGISLVA